LSDIPARARYKTILFASTSLILVLFLSVRIARRIVDFPVYYWTSLALLTGYAPVYGPGSGMGFPQFYRYPPLFLLLFSPLTLLPLKSAAVLWTALQFAVLYFLARALFLRLQLNGILARILALLPAAPYLVLEFHYGNAQFYVFALVALALLCMKKRPILGAFALALGISLKVWPLFFVPYCFALGYRRVAQWTLGIALGLTLVPAAFLGPRTYAQLLKQWGAQEFGLAATPGEPPGLVGFPSQSLHSMMMRTFVSLDYSRLPDSNYPKFNLAALDSRAVELAWAVLAAAGYAGLLLFASRQRDAPRFESGPPETPQWETNAREINELRVHSVAFCGYLLLQPFTQRTDLVVLLWPILVGAGLLYRNQVYREQVLPRWSQAALWAALSLMVLQALLPGAATQRTLEVLGLNFWLTCLLTFGLLATKKNGTPLRVAQTDN